MQETQQRAIFLLERMLDHSITPSEREEFLGLYRESQEMVEALIDEKVTEFKGSTRLDEEAEAAILESIFIAGKGQQESNTQKPVRKMQWWKYAAAAVFIGIMAVTGWLILRDHRELKQNSLTKIDLKAPATNRARITLANGKTVYLDSAANGNLAALGNIQLIKLADGQVAYSGGSDKIEYNTITNPRGSKVIDLAFVDGSHVWLNAGSSVTYPVPFEGNERKVKISGEAYFEIAHNAARPFRVVKGDMEVTVFGTHFNVNAYDDEKEIKVTLLEGSVKVRKGSANSMLKPGDQAQIANQIAVVNNVNTEQVMAWKDGQFIFNNTDIKTIMRQISRWYNVDVDYQGEIPNRVLGGSMDRTENANILLGILEETGIVHFAMENGKIIVIPGKKN